MIKVNTKLFIAAVALLAVILIVVRLVSDGGGVNDPPPEEPGILRVCLDAGHGGNDPGAMHPGGRMEKDDTLDMALRVYELLRAQGVDVILTRDTDVFVALDERARIANDSGATLFVSIHRNAGGGQGVEVWVNAEPTKRTTSFAQTVIDTLEDIGINRNRGVKRGSQSDASEDYTVNLLTVMDSCIVELGFIDSDEDNALLDESREPYAQAIADSIIGLR